MPALFLHLWKILHFMNIQKFVAAMQSGYTFKTGGMQIGAAKLDGTVYPECPVRLPLKTMNRHGLIAGATGTGKTKTLQIVAEGLSDAGVPVMLMDVKGDLSGLAAAGSVNDKINERYGGLGLTYQPQAYPVELLSLSSEKGARLRATVSEFGPVLLAKVLELNDAQEGLLAILFKFCDDNALPLLDLKDFSKVLQYAANEGRALIEKDYGRISTASLGTILRKVVELQQQGADRFFGELSFDIHDLIRIDDKGRGYINILRVTDMQSSPKLFSTFMLQMLAELYSVLPEEGDLDQPKLVLFIDEAHLIFRAAGKALLQQIETIVKLIRSKGVGIIFCTQSPTDIPETVLGQLGLKIQHALRAFTANDRKAIRQAAQNYPETDFYKTEDLITQLGIGEALITVLNEKGIPTPLVYTVLTSPRSRMDILSENEIDEIVNRSALIRKYNTEIDRESAYEILNKKIDGDIISVPKTASAPKRGRPQKPSSWLEQALNSAAGKQAQRSIVRSAFQILQKVLK